jgi:hypothetical protein
VPVRKLLEGASYDPETVRILCAAYDRAKQELHDSGQPEIVREILAQRILDMAEKGERDIARLCAGALRSLPTNSNPEPNGVSGIVGPGAKGTGSGDEKSVRIPKARR